MSHDPYQAPRSSSRFERRPAGRPGLALTLGIVGLVTWILPIIGLPVTITGLVFGGKALGGPKKGLAIAATVICSVGLALTALNMAFGAYLGATGQHAVVKQMGLGPQNK